MTTKQINDLISFVAMNAMDGVGDIGHNPLFVNTQAFQGEL